MKFVLLIREEESPPGTEASPETIKKYFDWFDEHGRAGHLGASAELDVPKTASVLRSRGGKLVVTDGPFLETKEQIGGFVMLEAKDRAEAVRIASTWPGLRVESVTLELRPVYEREAPAG